LVNGPVTDMRDQAQRRFESGPDGSPRQRRIVAIESAATEGQSDGCGFLHLSGSFYTVVHDPTERRTVVATDRLASRTVFSCELPGICCFSSSVGGLLRLPSVDPALDLEGVAQFVRFQMILEDRTLYRAIKSLPPATAVVVDHRANALTKHRYWNLSRLAPFASPEDAIAATADAFRAATRRILTGSGKACLLLSGGLDSRMLAGCLGDDAPDRVEAYTFGPGDTDEARVAARVALVTHTPWHFVPQSTDTYWNELDRHVAIGSGLYSAYHYHTAHTAATAAEAGYDTALDGWWLDLFFSGSYLPNTSFRLFGRTLYAYRLRRLSQPQEVVDYLSHDLDVQGGDFGNSMLGQRMRPLWHGAPSSAIARIVTRAQAISDSPYDWVEYALCGSGIAKFRSYPMVVGIRAHLRERNPVFESDVLDVYRQLPVPWRFHGPAFRRAIARLNPAVMTVPYANTGTDPLASPLMQAIALQGQTLKRANAARLRALAGRLGRPLSPERPYGAYPSSPAVALTLAGDAGAGARVRQLLVAGPLAQAGIVEPGAIVRALERPSAHGVDLGYALLNLASLAAWIDANPASVPS
jgi:asparagine synthase (glutamine-hydrolysing)